MNGFEATQLAVICTLLIPVVLYWTFKPEIKKLLNYISQKEKSS